MPIRSLNRCFSLAASLAALGLAALAPSAHAAGALATATQIAPPSWGLDRIDQRPPALDGLYRYAGDGAGIHVFVIDTGIRSTHVDLGGRVDTAVAFSTVDDGLGTEDCNGRGTGVADVIGGTLYGVAKGVTLHPVRVAGCAGTAAALDAAAAVDWVTDTVLAHRKGNPAARWRAVIDLSLSFPGTATTLNQAISRALEADIVVVAAAGDQGADRCQLLQPVLSVAGVIVVGAMGESGGRAPSSNLGSCLDLFAPGVDIPAAAAAGDSSQALLSGTAAAAAHVAGAAALYLGAYPDATPDDVGRALTSYATTGAVGDPGAGSPNRLLYSFFLGDGVDEAPIPAFDASCHRDQGNCAFDASASLDDVGIATYGWDFGDGETVVKGNASVHHKYHGPPATLTVTLSVTDTAGQTASVSRQLTFVQ